MAEGMEGSIAPKQRMTSTEKPAPGEDVLFLSPNAPKEYPESAETQKHGGQKIFEMIRQHKGTEPLSAEAIKREGASWTSEQRNEARVVAERQAEIYGSPESLQREKRNLEKQAQNESDPARKAKIEQVLKSVNNLKEKDAQVLHDRYAQIQAALEELAQNYTSGGSRIMKGEALPVGEDQIIGAQFKATEAAEEPRTSAVDEFADLLAEDFSDETLQKARDTQDALDKEFNRRERIRNEVLAEARILIPEILRKEDEVAKKTTEQFTETTQRMLGMKPEELRKLPMLWNRILDSSDRPTLQNEIERSLTASLERIADRKQKETDPLEFRALVSVKDTLRLADQETGPDDKVSPNVREARQALTELTTGARLVQVQELTKTSEAQLTSLAEAYVKNLEKMEEAEERYKQDKAAAEAKGEAFDRPYPIGQENDLKRINADLDQELKGITKPAKTLPGEQPNQSP